MMRERRSVMIGNNAVNDDNKGLASGIVEGGVL